MATPTFYQVIYADRVDGILEHAKVQIIDAKESLHRRFHEVLLRVASESYAHGLRDGFAQGVAAQAQSLPTEP